MKHWHHEPGPIAQLVLDCDGRSINVLDPEVFAELDEYLDIIADNPETHALLIRSGKAKGFIAGADIKRFPEFKSAEDAYAFLRPAQLTLDKLEELNKPSVAIIDGFCLGGGLEVALACTYRLASDSPKTIFGSPEVKLGIHPGWGGTIRLPKMVGFEFALQLMASGEPIDAALALESGLIDVVASADKLDDMARATIGKLTVVCRVLSTHDQSERPLIESLASSYIETRPSSKPVIDAILHLWFNVGLYGPDTMRQEALSIAALLMTEQSREAVKRFIHRD